MAVHLPAVLTVLGSIAGALVALGVVWNRAVHPALRTARQLSADVRLLTDVLDAWPETVQTLATTTAAAAAAATAVATLETQLAVAVRASGVSEGESREASSRLKVDMDRLWESHRNLEARWIASLVPNPAGGVS